MAVTSLSEVNLDLAVIDKDFDLLYILTLKEAVCTASDTVWEIGTEVKLKQQGVSKSIFLKKDELYLS